MSYGYRGPSNLNLKADLIIFNYFCLPNLRNLWLILYSLIIRWNPQFSQSF